MVCVNNWLHMEIQGNKKTQLVLKYMVSLTSKCLFSLQNKETLMSHRNEPENLPVLFGSRIFTLLRLPFWSFREILLIAPQGPQFSIKHFIVRFCPPCWKIYGNAGIMEKILEMREKLKNAGDILEMRESPAHAMRESWQQKWNSPILTRGQNNKIMTTFRKNCK